MIKFRLSTAMSLYSRPMYPVNKYISKQNTNVLLLTFNINFFFQKCARKLWKLVEATVWTLYAVYPTYYVFYLFFIFFLLPRADAISQIIDKK